VKVHIVKVKGHDFLPPLKVVGFLLQPVVYIPLKLKLACFITVLSLGL
jgi:hypothetical protein